MPVLNLRNTSSLLSPRSSPSMCNLLVVVHHDGKPVMQDLRQLVGAKKPFQQQDALAIAGVAQPHRVIEFQQRKCIGVGKRARDTQQTVPIRVGLDDRHDFGRAGQSPGDGEVVPERGEIETRPGSGGPWNLFLSRQENGAGLPLFYALRRRERTNQAGYPVARIAQTSMV